MSSKLKCMFKDASGKDLNIMFTNANASITSAQVRPLMEGMITNGNIYNTPPTAIVGASVITTTETPITL